MLRWCLLLLLFSYTRGRVIDANVQTTILGQDDDANIRIHSSFKTHETPQNAEGVVTKSNFGNVRMYGIKDPIDQIIEPRLERIAFLNCTSGEPSDSPLRRCCSSPDLPYGCECFDISPWSFFHNSWLTLPQCPAEAPVTFTLHNRQHSGGRPVTAADFLGNNSSTVPKQTVVVVHGYTQGGSQGWVQALRAELLLQRDANVVVVDWAPGAEPPYRQAVANMRVTAAALATLIDAMWRSGTAALDATWLIGHSLGAHLVGLAGQEIQRLTSRPVGRITGLDPAGPRFWAVHDLVALDASDAAFVDVIHTNGRILGEGSTRSSGHADFWPDGGEVSPGCAPWDNSCSHHRAHELFHASLLGVCDFDATNADGRHCSMGAGADTSCRGVFTLETYPARFPFC